MGHKIRARPAARLPVAGRKARNWFSRPPSGLELTSQLLFTALIASAIGLQALHAVTKPDFAMIWAAQRTAHPYSAAALNQVLGSTGHFFPYPPTTLLLTEPLGVLPYPAAYLAWGVLSACAFTYSLRTLLAPLALLLPAVFLAGLNGQTTLVMAALLASAAGLQHRRVVSGVLYGLAACLKPQIGILIPVFLVAASEWRTILVAVVTALVLAGTAVAIYGVHAWTDWANSLPAFVVANDAAWADRYLSLPGAWRVVALALGASMAFVAGRKGQASEGLLICIGAALLGSLHAMDYDQAVLAPFAVAAARRTGVLGIAFLVPFAFAPSRLATLALALLASGALVLAAKRDVADGAAAEA
jgi:hypothetical protein